MAVSGKYYEVLYEMVLRHWNTTDSKGQSVLVPSIQYAHPQSNKQPIQRMPAHMRNPLSLPVRRTFCEALRVGGGMDVTVVVQVLKWLRDLGKRVKLFERPEFVQSGLRWRLTGLLLDLATVTDGAASLAEEAGDVLYD